MRRSINGAAPAHGRASMRSMPSQPSIRSFSMTGASAASPAGRIERLSWASYTRQGKALLDHLKIQSAWIMGGCMGCSVALAFGVHYPEATRGLLLHWPVGGYRWKVNSRARFTASLQFHQAKWLAAVVERARGGKSFWMDSEGGPVGDEIARDHAFAESFASQDLERYLGIIHHQWPQPIRPRHSARRRAGRGRGRESAGADYSRRRSVACHFRSSLSCASFCQNRSFGMSCRRNKRHRKSVIGSWSFVASSSRFQHNLRRVGYGPGKRNLIGISLRNSISALGGCLWT